VFGYFDGRLKRSFIIEDSVREVSMHGGKLACWDESRQSKFYDKDGNHLPRFLPSKEVCVS
jgi:hypothetical protein